MVRPNRGISYLWWTAGAIMVAGVALGTQACSRSAESRNVLCDPVTVEGTEYCVYEGQSVANSAYDCPKDLSRNVEIEGGTICARDGEIPDRHREALARRVRAFGVGRGNDASDGGRRDGGGNDTGRPDGDVGPQDTGGVTCREPSSCPSGSTSSPVYVCHEPQSPPVGEAFALTVYGKHLARYPNGRVEVSTNTGYKEVRTVENRCKLTVDLPAYVWGQNSASFGIRISNRQGSIDFTVEGN